MNSTDETTETLPEFLEIASTMSPSGLALSAVKDMVEEEKTEELDLPGIDEYINRYASNPQAGDNEPCL